MARILKAKFPGTATFSPCGTYRYTLTRNLGGARVLASIGLNPSTADGTADDPTVAKEQRYARAWGYDFYLKLNAYGFRATKPGDMFAAQKRGTDIVGPNNDAAIINAMRRVKTADGLLLATWSNHIEESRQAAIAAMATTIGVQIWCLAINKNGTAQHALYLKDTLTPIPWPLPANECPTARSSAR